MDNAAVGNNFCSLPGGYHKRYPPGLACRKRSSLFRHRGLRPAARTLWAHWQAEKCFLARTCRARKRTQFDFATAVAKLCESFIILCREDTTKGIPLVFLSLAKGGDAFHICGGLRGSALSLVDQRWEAVFRRERMPVSIDRTSVQDICTHFRKRR